MTIVDTSATLIRDQFLPEDPETGGRTFNPWSLAAGVPGIVLGILVFFFGPTGAQDSHIGSLLTASSILTGITFAEAVLFWEKGYEARRDPRFALDAGVLTLLDRQKALLAWAGLIGVVATGVLIVIALLPALQDRHFLAVAATLVGYQVTLVAQSVIYFVTSSHVLRA